MTKCSYCDWDGDIESDEFIEHLRNDHPWATPCRSFDDIEGDIRVAEEQVGHVLDRNISDGDLDDEDLSDA